MKIKPLVSNHHQWQHFNNYIDFTIEQHHKILEQSTDIVLLHKAQGAIEILKKIKALQEYVKE